MDCSNQASISFTILQSLLKLLCIELVMSSSHLIFCRSLLLLPSIFPSSSFCFNELALHIKRPSYWNFSFSISCSNEYSRLISFRIDLFDLLLERLSKIFFQYHSTKASILQPSAFFIVQLSHPCIIPGKTIALTMCQFLLAK